MNATIELLVRKLINKAFPEFSNKVTWLLIYVGVGLIALPGPMYILFLNLIIDFYNNTMKANIKLVELNSVTPSTGVALTLIISGLVYHLAIKGIQLYPDVMSERKKLESQENTRIADVKMYETFIGILPPNSLSIDFLKNHDFGNSYHKNAVKDLDKLTYEWGLADQHFHDKELEDKASKLFQDINNFSDFLAIKSNPLGFGNSFTMLSDADRANDWDWLPQTQENVDKANKWSHEIYEAYCEFISSCKKRLTI